MPVPFPIEATGEDRTATCLAFPESALTAPITRHQPGSILAEKYRLEALLGEGGMGAVWRASNLLLELPVAIKLIRADLDRNALRARLQLEARSVAKVGHPAIVRVYDVSETEQGDPFIVMELLHGETLAQMLTRGRLSSVRAVQLLLPIIDACACAHARGIVHR
ncbi:MAG TPA: serine/threonine-protein kinase, partial [Polyangiaceae bacterium]